MTAIKLTKFGGMIPAEDDRLLPDNNAASSQNTWLLDGTLRGFRPESLIRTLTNPSALKAFRIPNTYGAKPTSNYSDSTWLEFTDQETDVVRNPVQNDSFDRYYWAGQQTSPQYNTLARIQAGQPAFVLGVPSPRAAITITHGGGTSSVPVTRAYVYTWVTTFGEEGPPSAPTIVTGLEDDLYNLTLTAPTSPDTTNTSIATARIYRTVTSASGVATYFFVTQVNIATTAYQDGASDTVISANAELASTTWIGPPTALRGIIALPNGMLAGWVGTTVFFCEPYRPHAWPAQYDLTVESPIVGMGAFGQTLVICTASRPVIITGISPSQMVESAWQVPEPCVSRASIVSTPDGVTYASPSGLVRVDASGVSVITRDLITKEEWLSTYDPYTLRAVRHATSYFAINYQGVNPTVGVFIDRGLVSFNTTSYPNILKNIWSDYWTGDTFVIHDGNIYHFNPSVLTGMNTYTWTSKEFVLPFQENLGACKVLFTVPDGTPSLNPTPNSTLEQNLASDQWALLKMYADGVHTFTREIRTSGQIFKFPSGYKATLYQFEIDARIVIKSIEIASSSRELRKV